jgi:hypothetical protein
MNPCSEWPRREGEIDDTRDRKETARMKACNHFFLLFTNYCNLLRGCKASSKEKRISVFLIKLFISTIL